MPAQDGTVTPLYRKFMRELVAEFDRFRDTKGAEREDARNRCVALLKLRREVAAIDEHFKPAIPAQPQNRPYILRAFLSHQFAREDETKRIREAFAEACERRGQSPVFADGTDTKSEQHSLLSPMIVKHIQSCDVCIVYMGGIVITLATEAGEVEGNGQVGPDPHAQTMRPWLLWEAGVAVGYGLPIAVLGHTSICKEMKASVFQGHLIEPVSDADLRPPEAGAWPLVGKFEKCLKNVESQWRGNVLSAVGGDAR